MSTEIILLVEKLPEIKVKTVDRKTRKFKHETRSVHEVSQGEHVAFFEEGETVKTRSREFADFLINSYGLKEVEDDSLIEQSYPADFPGRKVFIKNKIAFESVAGLDRENLIEIKGIGPDTADEVIAYFAAQNNGGE